MFWTMHLCIMDLLVWVRTWYLREHALPDDSTHKQDSQEIWIGLAFPFISYRVGYKVLKITDWFGKKYYIYHIMLYGNSKYALLYFSLIAFWGWGLKNGGKVSKQGAKGPPATPVTPLTESTRTIWDLEWFQSILYGIITFGSPSIPKKYFDTVVSNGLYLNLKLVTPFPWPPPANLKAFSENGRFDSKFTYGMTLSSMLGIQTSGVWKLDSPLFGSDVLLWTKTPDMAGELSRFSVQIPSN